MIHEQVNSLVQGFLKACSQIPEKISASFTHDR
jgi:hypothetical protein